MGVIEVEDIVIENMYILSVFVIDIYYDVFVFII